MVGRRRPTTITALGNVSEWRASQAISATCPRGREQACTGTRTINGRNALYFNNDHLELGIRYGPTGDDHRRGRSRRYE